MNKPWYKRWYGRTEQWDVRKPLYVWKLGWAMVHDGLVSIFTLGRCEGRCFELSLDKELCRRYPEYAANKQ